MAKQRDYYEILGVSRSALQAEIRRAYRKLAKHYHPDHNPEDPSWAEGKFKEIHEAYKVLSDVQKRADYDSLRESDVAQSDREHHITIARPDAKRPFFRPRILMPLLIVAAALAAYFNSFAGVFMFDDRLWIIGDRRLKALWPLWEVLRRRRPVVDYSLALNHAVGGDAAWGFHAVNLTIHILSALTLFGIVRRTLTLEPLHKRFGRSAGWLATVIGLLWVVHPLQTQSIDYLIQRAESLMGLFYLLTLYCVIRGASSSRAVGWYALAVVSGALGMGSKAVMVTVPFVVLLYDRAFLSATWGEVFRRRWGLYIALVATWSMLGLSGEAQGVLDPQRTDAHVGFGYRGVSPLGYALTQCGVLLHYLKLSILPHPLCLDYDWPMARTVAQVIPQGIALLTLLAATIWAIVKRQRLGFVAAWFFIVLAPTSSIVPIKDAVFEHRMYLPLASIVVLIVLGVDGILRRMAGRLGSGGAARRIVGTALTILAAAGLLGGTARRNQTYHSESAMWRDVATKRPRSARAAENLGVALLAEKKLDEALAMLQEAVKVNPHSANVLNGLGFALVAHGRLDEAVQSFREAIRWNPRYERAYINLGNAMNEKGRPEEALQHFATAVQVSPSNTDARLNLGNSYLARGDVEQAIAQYAWIVQFDPVHAKGWGNLGYALLSKASADLTPRGTQVDTALLDRAVQALRRALAIDPKSYNAWNNLGIVLMTQASLARAAGKPDEAAAKLGEGIEAFRGALQVRPDLAGAHYNIANALVEKGDDRGALAQYVETLKIDSRHVNARYEMGMLLWKNGGPDKAEQMLQTVIELAPDHPDARKALDDIRRQKEAPPTP